MLTGMLSAGDEVRARISEAPYKVGRMLGSGGQGEVYEGTLEGSALALKWYYPHTATDQQRAILATVIEAGAPDGRFLWPIEMVSSASVQGFGYLMPLRAPRFRGIPDVATRRVKPSFQALTTASVHLADAFLQLHAKGLCYRDISDKNVFLDPTTGEILICDNDNVGLDQTAGAIDGTPRFMAPEIVRGESVPSTQTDLFSLAVLLFLMLLNHHPLDGAREAQIHCFDLPAMTRLYGTEPLFIFDPSDASNAPVRGLHDNALAFWPLYPSFLRDLFTRAFTMGLADASHGRVRESTWRSALSRLRDVIFYCACGAENFYDDAHEGVGTGPGDCWSCHRPLQLPPRIRMGRAVVMLNHDARLFQHQADPAATYQFAVAFAEVDRHPTDSSLWGLKNLGGEPWTAVTSDGRTRQVEPGRSLALISGTQIHFGKFDGEILV